MLTKTKLYRSRRGSGSNRSGFTMIELMVTLAIMALLTGIIMPSAVSALRRSNVESRGEDLIELFRFGQRYAVTSHHPVQVNLDSQKNLCWVSVLQTKLPWLEQSEDSKTRALETMQFPPEYHLTIQGDESLGTSNDAWKTVTFKSDGRSDDTLIQLSDETGMVYEIMVFGANGSIQRRSPSS